MKAPVVVLMLIGLFVVALAAMHFGYFLIGMLGLAVGAILVVVVPVVPRRLTIWWGP